MLGDPRHYEIAHEPVSQHSARPRSLSDRGLRRRFIESRHCGVDAPAHSERYGHRRQRFAGVPGRYVREQGLRSLEQAIHKMTGLTARHLGFVNRGVLREGAIADLVLFDPATVTDRATAKQPDRISSGILGVWVAGQRVYNSGTVTEARPGRIIRSSRAPSEQ
jgi:N-acyl-D-aspartate/D-glutamate deacylase